MKSSLLPPKLPMIFTGLLFALVFPAISMAEDVLIMKAGPERRGEVLSVSDKGISLKAGPATTTIPTNMVVSVTKDAPAELAAAEQALQADDFAKALPTLKAINAKFLGLPSPWAEQAALELGEAYIGLNQIPDAEKAYADFQKAYPQSAAMANIGLAQLALAKKNTSEAKAKLEPIIVEATGVARADGTKARTYGRAYYLMGQVLEAEGNSSEALKNYLTTVTIFYQDPALAAKAKEKADQLQKTASVP